MKLILALSLIMSSQIVFADQRDALQIATSGLRKNIITVKEPTGLKSYVLTGSQQYRWVWARDFAWSSAGVIDIGRADAVHDTLEVLFGLQQESGLLPRGFDNHNTSVRYVLDLLQIHMPFHAPFKGVFVSENGVVTIDTNALLPWAANAYIQRTQDRAFAEKWWNVAQSSIAFLEQNYFHDGLIADQPPFADWEDSIRRTGSVAYTNEAYLMALRSLSEWADFLGHADQKTEYANRFAAARQRFLEHFWLPKEKHLLNFDGDPRITMDANLMAVVYDLVPNEIAVQIMETLRASPLWQPLPGRTTYPDFPNSMKSRLPKISGTGHYHDSQYWLWLTALAAEAEKKSGNSSACEKILDQASDLITEYGDVYENYAVTKHGSGGKSLKPVRTWLYSAEVPFTWSCGMMIHAFTQGCR